MTESVEERLKNASPKELRPLATEMLRGKHPELLRREPEPTQPGPGDGGTTSTPTSCVNLQNERDPVRVLAEARRIAGRS